MKNPIVLSGLHVLMLQLSVDDTVCVVLARLHQYNFNFGETCRGFLWCLTGGWNLCIMRGKQALLHTVLAFAWVGSGVNAFSCGAIRPMKLSRARPSSDVQRASTTVSWTCSSETKKKKPTRAEKVTSKCHDPMALDPNCETKKANVPGVHARRRIIQHDSIWVQPPCHILYSSGCVALSSGTFLDLLLRECSVRIGWLCCGYGFYRATVYVNFLCMCVTQAALSQ